MSKTSGYLHPGNHHIISQDYPSTTNLKQTPRYHLVQTNIQKPQQLIPYLILTPQQNATNVNASQLINQSLYRFDVISLQGNLLQSFYRQYGIEQLCIGFQSVMKQFVVEQQQLKNSSQQQPQINQTNNRISSIEAGHTKNHNNNNNNKNMQLGEIDLESNSFLTKPFFVQKSQLPVGIDEVVVFKGSVDISVEEMMEIIVKQQEQRKKQRQFQQSKQKLFNINRNSSKQVNSADNSQTLLLSRLYISCELFLISNYSTDPIGEWRGYSLIDEGSVLLPVSFFSYNSSYSLVEVTFLWSKVQYIPQRKSQTYFTNDKRGQERIEKIISYIEGKYDYLSESVLKLPKQYSVSNNNNSKNIIKQQVNSSSSNLSQRLLQKLGQYNEKTYSLWKAYQEFIHNTIQSKGRLRVISNSQHEQKLSKYQQALNNYHWQHHIQLTQSQKPTNSSPSINSSTTVKFSLSLDRDLVFYPFIHHHRLVRLSNDDMNKIQKICSLSLGNKMGLVQQQKHSTQTTTIHLLIFVHGYQASSYDMQNLASFLKYKNPQRIRTFVSSCNQNRTQQPIQESGHRLAIQIKNYINNRLEHEKQEIEISFVCHSMGGLIVRAALKYLQLYKSQFRMYLSLCSPHLGYLYHSSALIKTSLWVLNQVKKDPSMIELSMQDNSLLQKTYLYQLSKRTQLQWFKYPIFIGSREDQYVPYWSALVQDKQFYFQTTDAKIYKQLYKQLTENIQHKIIRLETIYQDKINDISSFVGRTAHIRILNCIEIMEIIYMLVQKAF